MKKNEIYINCLHFSGHLHQYLVMLFQSSDQTQNAPRNLHADENTTSTENFALEMMVQTTNIIESETVNFWKFSYLCCFF